MGYKITVPAVSGHSCKVALCNVQSEDEALRLTEKAIGYQVVGIAYLIDDYSTEALALAGVKNGCVHITEGS